MSTFTIVSPRHRTAVASSSSSGAHAGPSSSSSTTSHLHNSGAVHPCSTSSTPLSARYALDALASTHIGASSMDLDHGDGVNDDDDDDDYHGGADATAGSSSHLVALPGEPIASSALYMRGHGTMLTGSGTITSTHSGTLQLTNKLVSIPPIRTRYLPEIGDLVVAQVTSLSPKRWKVDIASRSDASLLLASINLPGGVQRRKLESDELQMRSFFAETDWLVAEVQSVYADGTVGLHTRSLRYGKLRNGTVVKVQAGRVKRLKSHFCTVTLPADAADGATVELDVILGLNGYVWISKHVAFSLAKAEAAVGGGGGGEAGQSEAYGLGGKGIGRDVEGVYAESNEAIDAATRAAISRLEKTLRLLDRWGVPISDTRLERAYTLLAELERGGTGHGVDVDVEVQRCVVDALRDEGV